MPTAPGSGGRLERADARQIEQLWSQYAPDLARYFSTQMFNRDLAAELVSDTFAALASEFAAGSLEPKDSERRLRRLARDQLSSALARRRQSVEDSVSTQSLAFDIPDPSLDDLPTYVDDVEEVGEIRELVDQLPEREKLVISLTAYEERSISEVAAALGMPPGVVRQIQSRALQHLAMRRELALLGGASQATILSPDGEPLSGEPRRQLDIHIAEISEELIALLAANPELVYDLPPRRFEELVAELYSRRGFEATLTPPSKDGGADVFVVRHDELGSSLSVVQCKRYAPHRRIGVGVVRELHGTLTETGATAGVLLTTSFFTNDARRLEERFRFELSLQDYYALTRLLSLPPLRS